MTTHAEVMGHLQRYYGDQAGIALSRSIDVEKDLGMDSLDKTEMIINLERDFAVNTPDSKWSEVSTIGEVIDLILHSKNDGQ